MFCTKEESMEARFAQVVLRTAFLACACLGVCVSQFASASGYRTTNFTVSAPTPQLAKEIGDRAEACRRDLAIEWLGKELPPWSKPCPVHARVAANLGAGGATSFVFDRGQVFGWKMNIQGSRERILDSVVPHEVMHTIFATHFRRPLPRWADEGACTTVEHRSEIAKQERMLIQFLKTQRGIAFSDMFLMKEYPPEVMPLYAQGHSLAQWLIESRGRKAFLDFLADGMQDENWPRAVHEHYGFAGLGPLQNAWLDWVKQGRPRLTPQTSPIGQLASNRQPNGPRGNVAASNPIVRTQSPDDVTPIAATEQAPSRPDAAGSAVVVASASGSVYAEAAARAERERLRMRQSPANPSTAEAPSVYDASLQTGILRR
jgi:hypothetical protein